jgi:hypothetical protein
LNLEKEKDEAAKQALLATQEEERLQLEKDKVEEERLELLQQEETEKALSLEKEKDEAAKQALLAKQEEERLQLEIEKAEEERLALLAKQEEERLQLEKDKEDKDKDVDKEDEESDNARGKQPYEDLPPPPQQQPPTMDLQGLWTAFLAQQNGNVQHAAVPSNLTKPGDGQPPKKKRKTSRGRTKVKGEKTSEGRNAKTVDADGKEPEEEDLDDFDWDDQHVQQSANTARRILWQRGHAANVPSKVKELIAAATVSRVEDAMEPLQTLGFAILEDMTVAFSPKNRCTKEQRDFITKCNTHTFPYACMRYSH